MDIEHGKNASGGVSKKGRYSRQEIEKKSLS